MKAVVYKGPYQVAVEDVPELQIQRPDDVIVKITSTAICGSDLMCMNGFKRHAALCRPGFLRRRRAGAKVVLHP
ncbi:alcohol dehydrogenase catalytic domain-containing protein [Desulfotomaculum copahuensis]|uniref:Uncharacterized protein n=1 Tax=Desulfotomaculum copahuensis TaxID=1838280 RepID=A0A1B7LCE9_9FIRM|nr:alcohol dehydrogenase catalytic domain-containing protein [Desulfotomaculum copahuensis]OAT80394.1 hypothetical protein A6M21_13590 [Desulfotomaculum copahuensis]